MGLFKPAWMSDNKSKALKAVEKETSQAVLIKIINSAQSKDIRRTAIRKCTDQPVLAGIAATEKDYWLRREAVMNLTDQAVLLQIAKNRNEHDDIRITAAQKISEPAVHAAVLSDIITESSYIPDDNVRRNVESVIKSLSDFSALSKIMNCFSADTNLYKMLRNRVEYLLHQINDQSMILNIIKDDNIYFFIRETAVEKITKASVLAKLATDSDYPDYIRRKAIENSNLSDKELMAKIVKNDTDIRMRKAALEKIFDQSILADVAKNDDFYGVRQAAAAKLNDQSLIADIAMNDPHKEVRRSAVEKLHDQSALIFIAQNDKDAGILCCAFETLYRMKILKDDETDHIVDRIVHHVKDTSVFEKSNICYRLVKALGTDGCKKVGLKVNDEFDGWNDNTYNTRTNFYYKGELI